MFYKHLTKPKTADKKPAYDRFSAHTGSGKIAALHSEEDDPARVEFLEELRRKRLEKTKPEGWPDEGDDHSQAARETLIAV